MSTPNEPQDTSATPAAAPKKHGCFFYGCLTSIVIAVLLVIGVCVAGYYGLSKFANLALAYTDTEPMTLPAVQVDPAVYAALQKRVQEFKTVVDAGKPATLALTADELNMLVAGDKNAAQWKGRVWFEIKGNDIKGQLSMPLDFVSSVPGLGKFKGRYLNGAASVQATMALGVLVVRLQSLEVKGKPLPDELMAALSRENLAKDATRNRETAAFLARLADLTVQDGKLILTGKAAK
ncbi:MAG: hypothetical protein NTY01_04525 [Verrucomicrobia bacterium]|nr:hypothetical protein [Verrucomicrobiota bacterium]